MERTMNPPAEGEAIERKIAEAISAAVRALADASLGAEEIERLLEKPKDAAHGDLAFPCFILAKTLRKAPPQIAQALTAHLQQVGLLPGVTNVAAVGPYVNFFLDRGMLAAEVIPAILRGELTAPRPRTGERVMVEYSQPNTHKAFHVGHCRCAALGDSVVRLIEWDGSEVMPVNYLGDEGTHVAKCLWYLRTHYKGEIPKHNRGEFLGVLYNKAHDLLDLGLLTAVPMPGVRAARVVAISSPVSKSKEEWRVIELDTDRGRQTVVCGGIGFGVGDLVAYAAPGVTVNGKVVDTVLRGGVSSAGMILSERELGLSENHGVCPVLPGSPEIGTEVAEVYRIEGALPEGVSVLEENRRRNLEVGEVLQRLERRDPEVYELWKETKAWSVDEYHEIYRWLNCRFDHFFYESEFGEEGKRLTREYQERGVFVESEGAVGADLRSFGLGFCILIKRDGTAMYATRDLALAQRKFDQYKIDRSIYVVDSAQTPHFEQVFKCLELMGYPQVQRCFHLAYAQVIRPDGKMSSRRGNVILFSQLVNRLTERIHGEFLDKYRGEWSDEEREEVCYRIALATIRYGMLNQDNNSVIVFDLDQWTSRTGNTGPYLMYAYARIRSILREVGEVRGEPKWALLSHESEGALVLHLREYPRVLARAAEAYSPLVVCTYIYELAKLFSRWYQHCSVLNAESDELRGARTALVDGVGKVLAHGLEMLGIVPVERM